MAKFFVSYSRSVKDEVQKVVDLLRASGHEVWWDGDIPIMADWWATILKNIEWCDTFIFVTSEKSVVSPYCIAELKYANDRQRPILPFILDDPSILTLPSEMPSRGQWLMYNGDPAQMLSQINYAVSEIDLALHRDINVPRPPEPMTGGKSLAKQFQEARQLANTGKFEQAKQRLRNIKALDYGEWGDECDDWIEQISRYESIVDLADHETTLRRAEEYWQSYVKDYGREFDPNDVEAKLYREKTSSNIPFVPIMIGVVVVLAIIGIAGLALSSQSTEESTQTPTTQAVVQVETEPTTDTESDLSQEDVRATGAAQAYETLTALAPTNTPTITPTPTKTPISVSDIQKTAQSEIFATETSAVQTQAVFEQQTQIAVQTEQFIAGSTATYIAQLSLTPPATDTLEPTNTSEPPTITQSPYDLAKTPLTSNANWTPYEEVFDGVTMVLVPAGCFMMGSSDEEIDYAVNELDGNRDWFTDEQPEHEQCIEAPFWIDKYEVTQANFARLGGQNDGGSYFDGENRPEESVTWFEARDFCQSRGGRLPTEKEWEYVASGPSNLYYPWGNEWNEDYAVWSGNSSSETASVGSRPEGISWAGAYDMSGNVWEWVSSLYQDYDYDTTHENDTDTSNNRVLRGGSWFSDSPSFLRASNRNGGNPSYTFNIRGFRCVRS